MTRRTSKKAQSGETDHEFRLRMAKEGKALYTPGKTVEETRAEIARKLGKGTYVAPRPEVAFFLAGRMEETYRAVSDAEEAFGFLTELLANGDHEGDPRLSTVMRICHASLARALDQNASHVEEVTALLFSMVNAEGKA